MVFALNDNLLENYNPNEDKNYMSPQMLEYFNNKLIKWRHEVIEKAASEDKAVHEGIGREPDHVDEAVNEVAFENEVLSFLNRDRGLLFEIENALTKIEQGSYGFCEITGEPIGVARLDAWPIATLSISAQEEKEQSEKKRQA
jgi:DnaK suppressor protein